MEEQRIGDDERKHDAEGDSAIGATSRTQRQRPDDHGQAEIEEHLVAQRPRDADDRSGLHDSREQQQVLESASACAAGRRGAC